MCPQVRPVPKAVAVEIDEPLAAEKDRDLIDSIAVEVARNRDAPANTEDVFAHLDLFGCLVLSDRQRPLGTAHLLGLPVRIVEITGLPPDFVVWLAGGDFARLATVDDTQVPGETHRSLDTARVNIQQRSNDTGGRWDRAN